MRRPDRCTGQFQQHCFMHGSALRPRRDDVSCKLRHTHAARRTASIHTATADGTLQSVHVRDLLCGIRQPDPDQEPGSRMGHVIWKLSASPRRTMAEELASEGQVHARTANHPLSTPSLPLSASLSSSRMTIPATRCTHRTHLECRKERNDAAMCAPAMYLRRV